MAEDAIADVLWRQRLFFEIFEDEEQKEQHRLSTRRHRQRRWVHDVIHVCILLRCTSK